MEVDARNIFMITTMALAIISNSLKEASYLFVNSSVNVVSHRIQTQMAKQAYAFIQGTGLDIIIEEYSLDLNANRIRNEFNRIFGPTS